MSLGVFALWILAGLLAGLLASLVTTHGSYGLRWDISQTRWVSPDAGLVAVTIVAAGGAAGLILAQRQIWAATVQDTFHVETSRRAQRWSPSNPIMDGGADEWTRTESD